MLCDLVRRHVNIHACPFVNLMTGDVIPMAESGRGPKSGDTSPLFEGRSLWIDADGFGSRRGWESGDKSPHSKTRSGDLARRLHISSSVVRLGEMAEDCSPLLLLEERMQP
jgi:hypothetical protein